MLCCLSVIKVTTVRFAVSILVFVVYTVMVVDYVPGSKVERTGSRVEIANFVMQRRPCRATSYTSKK
jgi:hypothetical protein